MFTSKLWWRNTAATAIALSSVALAIPLSVNARHSYAAYWSSRVPVYTIEHGAKETIDGQEWLLGEVRQLNRAPKTPNETPRGTRITVVQIVRIGPPSSPPMCTAYLADGNRRWQAEAAYRGDFWVAPKDGTTYDCREPGSLQFSFLLPDDARPLWLDLIDPANRIWVRLSL